MKRLFIGIPLTDEARRGIEGVMKNLDKKHWKVKWEPEEKWHITMAFFGEMGENQADQVKQVLRELESKPFRLKLRGLGRYPETQRISRIGERVSGRKAGNGQGN